MADRVGRLLGNRYRLLTPIGSGASAQVFLAEDVTLRRRVAVKVLHPAMAEDEPFLRRFRAEAQQAAALNHPHVMRVFDWGESSEGPFLVLEHLGGGSLRDVLAAGHRLSPSQALMVGLEAAKALEYAHRRGLVHRDVKPANLVFDEEGRLCVADFGLARALAEAAWTEPAGVILGTARYASPEQAKGLSVDGKADVYSLALVLVEAVTGKVPFSADTTIATLMARIDADLEVPEELGSLAPALVAATAPNPADRLEARELVAALEQAARHLPAPAPVPLVPPTVEGDTVVLDRDDPDLTKLGMATPATADPDGTELGLESPAEMVLPAARRRRRRWPWLLAALLFAVAAAAAVMAIRTALLPEHPVPSLRGKTIAQARAEVADEEFEVRTGPDRFDETLPPGQILEQDPSPLRQLREGGTVTVVLSKGPAPRAVPDLTNLDQAAAEKALTDRGLVPKIVPQPDEQVPKGTVLAWSPTGQELQKGTEVTVTVSAGPAPREIPDVTGKTYDEAAALLAGAGLKAEQAEVFSSDVDKGLVVSTKPAVGRTAERDSVVTVNVSKGPDTVPVPDVVGRTVADATAALRAAGLEVSGTGGRPGGRLVFLTDPQAGTKVVRGTGVFLFVR
jgi:beta-lactam-binding protein with PASTA domain/tRNA A-37 threonylcarbamoyl transferase component Bud32